METWIGDAHTLEPDGQPTTDPVAILQAIVAAWRLTRIYPPGHRIVEQKIAELDALLGAGLAARGVLRIDIAGGAIHLDGIPVSRQRLEAAENLSAIGVDSLHFHRGLHDGEIRELLEVLQDLTLASDGLSVEERLAERGIQHATLGRLVPLDTRWQSNEWPDRPGGQLDPAYAESLRMAESTFREAQGQGRVDAIAVRELVDLLMLKVASSSIAISQILLIKKYENLTYCHSVNVAMLTLLLARQVRLHEGIVTALVEAALLHDIGKTRIPVEVMQKPGALDQRERAIIETHPLLGAEILAGVTGLHPLTLTIALEHHRTVKGGGYPDLGAGVVPHVLSQLVSVADIYEAVTGARSYRKPMQPESACLLLARLSGDTLNTSLVKAFINAITFFPVGSFVRTNLNEYGVVVGTTHDDVLHPVIALLDENLETVAGTVDTRERDAAGGYVRHVAETLTPERCPVDIAAVLAH